jgi:hypothetical protein
MYANYYEEEQQQQQPAKFAKLSNANANNEDYYTYNYDLYRQQEQGLQFEGYATDGSYNDSDHSDHSDTLSCASNDFDNHSDTNNSESEAEEWKDVLNFFCGWDMENEEETNEFSFDFRENQPQFL